MALSAEFGFYLIAPPAPLSGINILSCPSSRSRNCLTIPPLPMSCCVATRGSDSLCWLHPVLSPRRRAVPKRKWVQFRFSRDCSVRTEASDVASQSSEQLSAEDRGSPRYFPSKDGNLSPASSRQYGSAAPSGMSSARPFDLLSNAPTYPSSDDKQLSFKGGTAVGKSGIVSVSSDKFISPRQIFRSIGSRSVSSRPSIPGKFSKYSKRGNSKRIFDKNPSNRKYLHSKVAVLDSHEVSSSEELDSSFTRQSKPEDNSMPIPATSFHADQQSSFPPRRQFAKKKPEIFTDPATMPASELPFEFQFSYSETPKLNPIGFREPQFSPFGPTTMPRPWTGRAPLPKSKKKPKELDTFNPPPPGKKGVKAVHPPGPYKGGEGPKIAQSREEILGEPLTKEEITRLVEICNKEQRQINLGRDGLVHNMLDLIHCHWKRRRVIKIKCKGVPTVDMDNVCYHVEDKSGGKIIHRAGGAMYLFRGRNYNTKYRPQIPLMLWKPAAPIYPKLIVPAPGGLTKEEADAMRKRGRKVQPICKLGSGTLRSAFL
ncbi:hypothetical protein O6H91_12G076800 [Diphasiastrum complanatum]|uniref:Uncharacterized protein n=1 Tax=Diphasiastrum complanatum TaxID=34168 RepID=A0ACC2C441_DIPCM|nr:hypothetical protein O6H91_12G076800 [Diphasiastrum complanatum]